MCETVSTEVYEMRVVCIWNPRGGEVCRREGGCVRFSHNGSGVRGGLVASVIRIRQA